MMNEAFKLLISLTLSGSVLISVLFILRPLLKDRLSKRWQYYIWLLVIARLLLPFGPPESPAQDAVISMDNAAVTVIGYDPKQGTADTNPDFETERSSPEPTTLQEFAASVWGHMWVIWLTGALALLIRKITAYQSFARYIRTGWEPVDDPALLDRLAEIGLEAGIKRPIELYVNPIAASPMLLGIKKPCIILPTAALPDGDLRYILLHELTHYRRRDILYKWLMQVTLCIHWFNPLVHWMGREAERLGELSCDEAVIKKLDEPSRRAYGDALLRTTAAGGSYKAALPSATLGESGKLLKERLETIMKFKKPTKLAAVLSVLLAIILTATGTAAGAYTDVPVIEGPDILSGSWAGAWAKGARFTHEAYYAKQDEEYKKVGITRDGGTYYYQGEKLYIFLDYQPDNAFYTMAMNPKAKDGKSAKIVRDASGKITGTAYLTEAEIADLFGEKDPDEDEENGWDDDWNWNKNWDFDWDWDWDWDWNWDWDDFEDGAMKEAYKAVGVTMDGKNYYYDGKLVKIFLDHRSGSSYYNLSTNPKGAINIKITRDADNKITGVAPLTPAEIDRFFGPAHDEHVVDVDIDRVSNGEYVWLGEFELEAGDQIYYDVAAESGERLTVGFAKTRTRKPSTTYITVTNHREPGEDLEVTAGPLDAPKTAGTYHLFIHTKGGELKNVTGYVTIVKASKTE